jgi:hypothetical protein
MSLSPGERAIIEIMRDAGGLLTRREYIDVDWNDDIPSDEGLDLPLFLAEADDDDQVFDYATALAGGYG